MQRDSIFYKIFQQFPTILFEMLETSPDNAAQYRFDSVAVKEPSFTIDGVFLPPDNRTGIVYFCEVQFQRDELLYERLFGESFLYFYRNRDRFSDWQAVVIYPSRSKEQSHFHPYEDLIEGHQVHRVYLNELGAIGQLPTGLAVMVLSTLSQKKAPEAAKQILERSKQKTTTQEEFRAIIGIVTTVIAYKFSKLSRQEVEKMLGITGLQETRFYQEAKQEGRQEGRIEERQSLILDQLTGSLGELPGSIQEKITALSSDRLKSLGLALLKFNQLADLEEWLKAHPE
jgi:predicted transposase/invertase (TIGR01784 family)